MRDFFDWLNPWRRGGVRPHDAVHALITLALAAALVAVGFGAGYQAGTRHDAHFFETHYHLSGVRAPTLTNATNAASVHALPAGTLSIKIAVFPAVQDQQTQGSCAGFATGEDVDYDYRIAHPNHPSIRFSPEWMYTIYSDTYSGGQDLGSYPTQNIIPLTTIGIPQWTVYASPQAIVDPLPTAQQLPAVYANAAKFVMPNISAVTLYQGNPSAAAVTEIRSALAQGQPALMSINATAAFENATQTGGAVWFHANDVNYGGHEIVGIKYSPTHANPDGTVGATEIQNSWNTWWGLKGRAWLADDWTDANVWAVQMLQGVS